MQRDWSKIAGTQTSMISTQLNGLSDNYHQAKDLEKVAKSLQEEGTETLKGIEQMQDLKWIPGFFPTPMWLAEKMVEMAGITRDTGSVLEPSAGKGNIALRVKDIGEWINVTCVERNNSLYEILRKSPTLGMSVINADFLELNPIDFEPFDAVLLNPPFENHQDVMHVQHAFKFLKPNGVLVAIMSEHSFIASHKIDEQFRHWRTCNKLHYEEKLPDGAFKNSERPTGIQTRLLRLEKGDS